MSESPGADTPDPAPQRIGDADRDQAATYLREALAEGRLDETEFSERLDRALRARTMSDLDPLFADLPGPRPGQGPGQGLAHAAGFVAPPWQGSPASAPGSEVSQPASGAQVARSSGPNRLLDAIAWVIWPVTLLVLFATGWHSWWLVFIPIIVSSLVGKQRHDRNERDRGGRS